MRCCGSRLCASRGAMPKNCASNWSTSARSRRGERTSCRARRGPAVEGVAIPPAGRHVHDRVAAARKSSQSPPGSARCRETKADPDHRDRRLLCCGLDLERERRRPEREERALAGESRWIRSRSAVIGLSPELRGAARPARLLPRGPRWPRARARARSRPRCGVAPPRGPDVELLGQPPRELEDRRLPEDHRRRDHDGAAERDLELAAELHRPERAHAEVEEAPRRFERLGRREVEHARHGALDVGEQRVPPAALRERVELAQQRRVRRRRVDRGGLESAPRAPVEPVGFPLKAVGGERIRARAGRGSTASQRMSPPLT